MFKLFYVFAQDSVISRFKYFTDGIHSKYLYYCCICKFLKELLSIVSFETWCKGKDFYFYLPNKNSYQSFLSKRGAKVRIFIFIFQIFSKVFSIYFFRKLLPEQLQDIRLDLPTSSLGISISDFLSPLSSCHHRISLDCGCKSTAVKHILQMFSQLFYNYFLLCLIVNDLQIHFSPFFWFDTKETKTSLEICFTPSPFGRSFLTSIFHPSFFISPSQILNSQKAGVFLSFHAGFSAKDAGFFSFYAYLSKSNKRESISILTGFTFDSRLS